MRRTLAVGFALALMLGCGAILAVGQDESLTSSQPSAKAAIQESRSKPDQHEKPVQPYRLDFTLSELESGKKINTRHCSMNVTAGSTNEIKIGTRVPVSTTGSQFQYMDVGTNVWANLREVGDDLQLEVRSDVSNLDTSSMRDHSSTSPPIVRQIQINGKTLLVIGKTITVGTIDDPNSNHEFQLEVTAAKLR
jgi:hypothetical protein